MDLAYSDAHFMALGEHHIASILLKLTIEARIGHVGGTPGCTSLHEPRHMCLNLC